MKRKVALLLTSFAVVVVFSMSIYAYTKVQDDVTYENFETKDSLEEEHLFSTIAETGEVAILDVKALEKETQKEIEKKELLEKSMPQSIGGAKMIETGVVNFRTKPDSTYNTSYTEDGTNRGGYTNGFYAADGAFLGYNIEGTKVKFMQAGVIGWVAANEVEVIDYAVVKSVNFYRVEAGKIRHYATTNVMANSYSMVTTVGYKQSYMNDNTIYYSYDGHYFYTTYERMVTDYKNGVKLNAINANEPYYNYYQFLSHRTTTNINADMLNTYINTQIKSASSKMKNMGNSFINYQNIYGSNALLMFAVAANESAWGTSDIAQAKNNLFGHAAYDSSAGDSASGYINPDKSIYSHAKYFVSEGYLDPKDIGGRYNGAHLGDKASGMNVKYASDPYWGEKAAHIAWNVADTYGTASDSTKYTMAIKQSNDDLIVRKEATSNSNNIYQTGKSTHYPFIVLGSVNGQSINGNTIWYKIQSDPTLTADRTTITQDKGEYNFSNYFGYISGYYVRLLGGAVITPPTPIPPLMKGDVNLDGSITPSDYVMIRNHINDKTILLGNSLLAADVNSDGKVSPSDYVSVRKIINGK